MGLLDVLKRLRHGGRGIRACPRCGSTRIKRAGGFCGWLLPVMYVCPDCGYQGPLVLELELEEEGQGGVGEGEEHGQV